MPAPRSAITQSQYELLAALRRSLRRFQRFSQDAARAAGLTPQQHQALLAIKGSPGRDGLSIGAEQTYEEDMTDAGTVGATLLDHAGRVARRLVRAGLFARTIAVKATAKSFGA